MSDDDRIILGSIPTETPVIDLKTRRKLLDAEAENVALRADVERLKKALAESEQVHTVGHLTKHSKESCHFHRRVVVDEHSPAVECADCETRLDPYTVLLELATGERQFRSWTKAYIDEQKKLRAEIEILKKQRNAARAAVRRAGGKPIESWQVKAPKDGEDVGG